MIDKNEILKAVKETALRCGEIFLSAEKEDLGTQTKSGRRDLVTKFDLAVQNYAVSALKKSFPQAKFFCEETKDGNELSGEIVFIIDPIDGTANFVNGFHHSCISIGCLSFGEAVCGVVFDPYKNEMFFASKGNGAFLNGRKISVAKNDLGSKMVMFGTSPYNTELRDTTLEMLKNVYSHCLDVRRSGSAALDLCYVASSKAGLYFEGIVSLWDYAAGLIILREAGGEAYDFSMKPLGFKEGKTSIIAGSAEMIEEFLNTQKTQ